MKKTIERIGGTWLFYTKNGDYDYDNKFYSLSSLVLNWSYFKL
jgi:hypothetical protein